MVVKEGVIFKAGSYPQRGLTMTPDEVKAMAANFKPVPIDLNHKTTLRGIDSRCGYLTSVTPSDDGKVLFGRIEIPEWLNDLVGKDEKTGQPIPVKVSSTILLKSKRLAKLALTDSPVVDDAAVFAAFSKAHPDEAATVTIESEPVSIDESNNAEFAEFESDELKEAVPVCAACKALKDGQVAKPTRFSKTEENEMSVNNEKGIVESILEFATKAIEKAEAKTVEVPTPTPAPVIPPAAPVTEPKTAELSDEAKAQIAELQEQVRLAQEALAAKDASDKAAFAASVDVKAAAFADELIKSGAELPANKETCVALFAQAIRDDAASQTEVTFGKDSEGKEVKGGRVDALKALYASRTPANLTQEQLNAGATAALLSNSGGEELKGVDTEKVKERALKLAEQLNRRNRK
jgi:hypothetical protein